MSQRCGAGEPDRRGRRAEARGARGRRALVGARTAAHRSKTPGAPRRSCLSRAIAAG